MRKLLAFIIYLPLQACFIPFGILGAILIYYKQIYISQKYGVSSTAVEIINGRWTMHKFGLRPDLASVRLFESLPNTTSVGQWMVLFPLYVLRLIAGKHLIYPTFKEAPRASYLNLVTSRSILIDRLLASSLTVSDQFVVMGAGLDTRCYGQLIPAHLKRFELDQSETQSFKIDRLQAARINYGQVTFVAVDFTKEDWFEQLRTHGYQNDLVSTFLWEGVSLYLSRKDIIKTLSEIAQRAKKGSTIIADFYSEHFIYEKLAKGSKLLEKTNEQLGYGLALEGKSPDALKQLLEPTGLQIAHVAYLGSETKMGTWMIIAELKV